jgi:restriction endonuclease S subunit
MKLKNIVTIKTGLNSSRVSHNESKDLVYYSANDLEHDLSNLLANKTHELINVDSHENYLTEAGQVIQSLISQETSTISYKNSGKLINQNFVTFEFDKEVLNPEYLCYVLNQSDQVKRQRYALSQGTNIRKNSPQNIKELDIFFPTLDIQQTIGNIYALEMNLKRIELEKIFIEEQITLSKINGFINKGESNEKQK